MFPRSKLFLMCVCGEKREGRGKKKGTNEATLWEMFPHSLFLCLLGIAEIFALLAASFQLHKLAILNEPSCKETVTPSGQTPPLQPCTL